MIAFIHEFNRSNFKLIWAGYNIAFIVEIDTEIKTITTVDCTFFVIIISLFGTIDDNITLSRNIVTYYENPSLTHDTN